MNANDSESGESADNNRGHKQRARKKEKRSKEKKHKKKDKKKKRRISESEPENYKKMKKSKKKKLAKNKEANLTIEDGGTELPGPTIPPELLVNQAKSRAPMTKEEYEKSQNMIRKVYDEVTGRLRLIKGDNEVLEEIVSKERHREINKQVTKGDGEFFQNKLLTDRE